MNRWIGLWGLLAWVGSTLVLADLRPFLRRRVVDRIWPYVPGGWERGRERDPLSVASIREVLAPVATSVGGAVARAVGVHEDLAARLARLHRNDAGAVRVQQVGVAVLSFGAVALAVSAAGPPALPAAVLLLAAPLTALLATEHRIARASTRWQQRLLLELPVVCEQIGMLLGAGLSLGGALERVGRQGRGSCAADLRRVTRRVAQGIDVHDALQEWADIAAVPAVHRLVAVLALEREATDLGALAAEEARSLRLEARRDEVALLERRAQQVWVPVTIATLVPGVVFLAVPFVDALHLFAAG